jgi:hypothetical protein
MRDFQSGSFRICQNGFAKTNQSKKDLIGLRIIWLLVEDFGNFSEFAQ